MKKTYAIIFIVLAMVGTSCNNYLDINTNPNLPTTSTPQLVLPQALVATAIVMNGFNTYGAQSVGYMANAGGYGGFGEIITYQYTSSTYAGIWSAAYDNLEDYQYIIDQSEGDETQLYYNAVARIMKAYVFKNLVDAYNSVPYFDALKGAANLTPAYDDPKLIYADLGLQIDSAIAKIDRGYAANVAAGTGGLCKLLTNTDVVFYAAGGSPASPSTEGPEMVLWEQFANSIKLHLEVFGNGKVTFSNTAFAPVGFLSAHALVDPGYSRDNNRQNPEWNTWGYLYTLASGSKAYEPTVYVFSFYDGTKISDTKRGADMYYQFPTTGTNQLGFEDIAVKPSPTGSFWYPGADRATAPGNATGALKGPGAGFPLMTKAEADFLVAEAYVRGISVASSTTSLTDAASAFNQGVVDAFEYTEELENNATATTAAADAAAYMTANSGNQLVVFPSGGSTDQQIEAIITQKYIALNMTDSQEAWNDYRRTGYPSVSGTAPATTFASLVSKSTRPDKLPVRILYPTSENAYNGANTPAITDPFADASRIFWAK